MAVTVTKPCAVFTCDAMITGSPQKRFCANCRPKRYTRTVRYLARGEQVPPGEPQQQRRSHGYVALRWRIGTYEYVETYEHRVFNGRVTTADEVHHENRDRGDNREENLSPLTVAEHHALHGPVEWWAEAAKLYAGGLSTYQIGNQLGRNPTSVYRALVKLGVPLRKEARIAVPHRERDRS